jgi:hypothetical protein
MTSKSVSNAWNLTSRGEASSYGTDIFVDHYEGPISRVFAQWFSISQTEWLLKYGPLVGALGLFLMVGIKAISGQTSPEVLSDRNLAAFRMGSSIYVGTFLLGNNWDYRLAFLILTVPQLFEWARSQNHKYRTIAVVSVFLLMASCWHFVISSVSFLNFFERSGRVWFIFDEFCNWLLFMSFTYLIVVSMPGWIKDQVSNLLPKRYFVRSTGSITNFSK